MLTVKKWFLIVQIRTGFWNRLQNPYHHPMSLQIAYCRVLFILDSWLFVKFLWVPQYGYSGVQRSWPWNTRNWQIGNNETLANLTVLDINDTGSLEIMVALFGLDKGNANIMVALFFASNFSAHRSRHGCCVWTLLAANLNWFRDEFELDLFPCVAMNNSHGTQSPCNYYYAPPV